jgi:hypothetical protein
MLVDSFHIGISEIHNDKVISYNWTDEQKKQKQWVATVTGFCPKFGFKRNFCKFKKEKTRIFLIERIEWEIKTGFAYEYKNLIPDLKSSEVFEGFFIALPSGIICIDKDQLRTYLRMPVKDKEAVNEITFIRDFADDDIPF